MSKHPTDNIKKRLWRMLTGGPGEFTMENRAFNYVGIITILLLFYYLVLSIWLEKNTIVLVILGLLVAQAVLFYFSRYRKKFQAGIIIYAISSYLALGLNFFFSSGINGPTFCLLLLTFHLLVAIGKPKHYLVWIVLHTGIIISLLVIEYHYPEWVPDPYMSRSDRFIDIGAAYISVLVFIFAITNYLRSYLNKKRHTAEQSTKAILDINVELVAKNHELEKVNQEKNKLFSIVAHDLKSPLDAISGYLELLSGSILGPEDKAYIETQLRDQTKYTSDLLINLLSWAKSQMGGVHVHPVAVALKDLIDAVANNKISSAAKKDIKLTYSIDPNLEVIADRDMLRIVLRNLVNNAIKFTKPGGEIFIKAVRKGNEVEFSVQDTGIGIPPEKQSEIFTLKTESTYGTGNEKGIGLGLMMCKEFMDYQKGKIWFVSKPGVGTTFFVSLPVALR